MHAFDDFSIILCLVGCLMLSAPVNSYGHAGTLPRFYGTFTQDEDVIPPTNASNITIQVSHKGLYVWTMDGLTSATFTVQAQSYQNG